MARDELIRRCFALILHTFFRRIFVIGQERVPSEGAVVLVGNHVNGLLDPLLLLVASGRPARFLAKATLFHHPLVAPFLRLVKALPVYRKQDEGSEMSRNEATFEACEHLLVDGEVLALFPEGISHNMPHLQPLKTGAARIVGRATFRGASPFLIPAGLSYSAKSTFRSVVSVTFGPAIPYADLQWTSGEDPSAVGTLTNRLREAIEAVTVNAERWEDLRFIEGIREIALDVAGLEDHPSQNPEVTRTLIERFYLARSEHPTLVHALLVRARAYIRMLEVLGLRDADVTRDSCLGTALDYTWKRLALIVAGYPPAIYGWLFNFVPYCLTGCLALAIGGSKDTVATYKVYAGLVMFPLLYLAQGALLWFSVGPWWGLSAVVLGAPCGLWAVRYYALRDGFVRLVAATVTLRTSAETTRRLQELRAEVVEAIKPLVEMYR